MSIVCAPFRASSNAHDTPIAPPPTISTSGVPDVVIVSGRSRSESFEIDSTKEPLFRRGA